MAEDLFSKVKNLYEGYITPPQFAPTRTTGKTQSFTAWINPGNALAALKILSYIPMAIPLGIIFGLNHGADALKQAYDSFKKRQVTQVSDQNATPTINKINTIVIKNELQTPNPNKEPPTVEPAPISANPAGVPDNPITKKKQLSQQEIEEMFKNISKNINSHNNTEINTGIFIQNQNNKWRINLIIEPNGKSLEEIRKIINNQMQGIHYTSGHMQHGPGKITFVIDIPE